MRPAWRAWPAAYSDTRTAMPGVVGSVDHLPPLSGLTRIGKWRVAQTDCLGSNCGTAVGEQRATGAMAWTWVAPGRAPLSDRQGDGAGSHLRSEGGSYCRLARPTATSRVAQVGGCSRRRLRQTHQRADWAPHLQPSRCPRQGDAPPANNGIGQETALAPIWALGQLATPRTCSLGIGAVHRHPAAVGEKTC